MKAKIAFATMLALMGAGACGGDEGGADQFVGSWMITSGTATRKCPNLPAADDTSPVTGTTTISKGIDAPLVITEDGCTIKYDVQGSTASARPGQVCMQQGTGGAASVTINFTASTLTVTGLTASFSDSANINIVLATGQTVACSYTAMGMMMKVSK